MQVVDVVSSTVLYIYVSGPSTTAARPMKAHCPAHITLTNTGMSSIQTVMLYEPAVRQIMPFQSPNC